MSLTSTAPETTPEKNIDKDGEKTVLIDGQPRVLRMDFNALAKAEELTGKNFVDPNTWAKLSATDYRALILGCLLSGGSYTPSLTIDQVGHFMTTKNERELGKAVFDLYISEAEGSALDDEKTEGEKDFKDDGGGAKP